MPAEPGGARVGDDELLAGEAALDDLRQQLVPRVLGLLGTDGLGEELAVAVEAGAIRDERAPNK